jgi:putative methyltransferase
MALYHEAAGILDVIASEGGSVKSRVFSSKNLQSPKPQLFALVLETCKWSKYLKDVVDNSVILQYERKVRPPGMKNNSLVLISSPAVPGSGLGTGP